MAKRLPHPINRALIEKIAAASKTSELNSGKVVAVGPGSHDGEGKLSAVSWNEGGEKNLEVGVYAYSSAQVKKAIDIVDNLSAVFLQARFFEAAVAYKKTIGFNGTLCIEPHPQGPTKHPYDRDAATSANFLRKYGLIVKSEHLSEVRERNPAIANGEDSGSVKPFRFLEEQDGSNAWMNGAALPSEDNKWNAGGSTER